MRNKKAEKQVNLTDSLVSILGFSRLDFAGSQGSAEPREWNKAKMVAARSKESEE